MCFFTKYMISLYVSCLREVDQINVAYIMNDATYDVNILAVCVRIMHI